MADIADLEALQARLGRTLTGADVARAEAVLSDVSALARGVAGQEWPDAPTGVPADVIAVVLAAARRGVENPEGWISQTMGPLSATRAAAMVTGEVFTAAELAILRRARPRTGLWTLVTTRGDRDAETGFVADSRPGSDPIAYLASTDPGFAEADHYGGY
jgi:hypothetical protein